MPKKKLSFWDKLGSWLNSWKSSIATILAALIVFGVGRHLIAQDVAELFSTIMVALGLTVNAYNAQQRAKGIK